MTLAEVGLGLVCTIKATSGNTSRNATVEVIGDVANALSSLASPETNSRTAPIICPDVANRDTKRLGVDVAEVVITTVGVAVIERGADVILVDASSED